MTSEDMHVISVYNVTSKHFTARNVAAELVSQQVPVSPTDRRSRISLFYRPNKKTSLSFWNTIFYLFEEFELKEGV